MELTNVDLDRCVALLELVGNQLNDVEFDDEEQMRKTVHTVEALAYMACKELKEIKRTIESNY